MTTTHLLLPPLPTIIDLLVMEMATHEDLDSTLPSPTDLPHSIQPLLPSFHPFLPLPPVTRRQLHPSTKHSPNDSLKSSQVVPPTVQSVTNRSLEPLESIPVRPVSPLTISTVSQPGLLPPSHLPPRKLNSWLLEILEIHQILNHSKVIGVVPIAQRNSLLPRFRQSTSVTVEGSPILNPLRRARLRPLTLARNLA